MMRDDLHALTFPQRVDKACKTVKSILDVARNAEGNKSYDNLFNTADLTVLTALNVLIQIFEKLGLSEDTLTQLKEWSLAQRTVTLTFECRETCIYARTDDREEDVGAKRLIETTDSEFGASKTTCKMVANVIEHFWTMEAEWTLSAVAGGVSTADNKPIVLLRHKGTYEMKTLGPTKRSPRPATTLHPPIELQVCFLLKCFEDTSIKFAIDRGASDCRTPRRNKQVEDAIHWFHELHTWACSVRHLLDNMCSVDPAFVENNRSIQAFYQNLFSPVLAMYSLESDQTDAANTQCRLVHEYLTQFNGKVAEIAELFPVANETSEPLVTANQVGTMALLHAAANVCQDSADALDEIEGRLFKHIQDAIGKEQITSHEFTAYMNYHNGHYYKKDYRPQSFSYKIGRKNSCPEGMLSIRHTNGSASHIKSFCSSVPRNVGGRQDASVMRFALDGETKVSFSGTRYIHAANIYTPSDANPYSLQLEAKAHQFSSFVLIVGRIASTEVFEPTAAIIVKDNDDLKIPLMLQTIPTRKKFRDAIESLSPEQQRFCEAFRSMQLASTLFGVLVIQIKPALEKVLHLPDDSLTKEIQLSRDVMDMFTKWQIPSDLISCKKSNAHENSSNVPHEIKSKKIAEVTKNVKVLKDMIEAEKQEELHHTQQNTALLAAVPPQPFFKPDSDSWMDDDSMVDNQPKWRSMSVSIFHEDYADVSFPCAPETQHGASEEVQSDSTKTTLYEHPEHGADDEHAGHDFTTLPSELDRRCAEHDSTLKPTMIELGDEWSLKYQTGILGPTSEKNIPEDAQREKMQEAFSLLNALTRSGEIPITDAALHIMVVSTHPVAADMIGTVARENRNPIKQAKRDDEILANVIHGRPISELTVHATASGNV